MELSKESHKRETERQERSLKILHLNLNILNIWWMQKKGKGDDIAMKSRKYERPIEEVKQV